MHHSLTPLTKNIGMEKTYMAFCFLGSLSLTFGAHWLCIEMLMLSCMLFFCILPAWTPAILYLRYNTSGSTKFETWWYFSLTVF